MDKGRNRRFIFNAVSVAHLSGCFEVNSTTPFAKGHLTDLLLHYRTLLEIGTGAVRLMLLGQVWACCA